MPLQISKHMVSHVLRTPITCILGFSHILNSTDLTPKQKECLENIDKSAYQLLAATELLVKNLSTRK